MRRQILVRSNLTMLRFTACFLIAGFLFTIDSVFVAPRVESNSVLTLLTNTPEHTTGLNPTLSDDGNVIVFESSADLLGGKEGSSFHAFRAELAAEAPVFRSIAATRAISPAVSSDGRIIAFASTEDL